MLEQQKNSTDAHQLSYIFRWADWMELRVFMGACAAGIFVKERRLMISILTIMILLCLSDAVATLLEK
jgi:hypothetical protein